MKILITGGAGFIGSHIARHYSGRAEVVVLDNLRSGFEENLTGTGARLIRGSITDRKAVREAVCGCDYVFHLAAMISVPESMHKPQECVETNVQGLLNVLSEASEAGVKRLCFSTSAAIYGDNPTVPKLETMLPEPKSPYAITKLDGEYYCNMFSSEGLLSTACLRYFNVFGPRQDPKSQYAAAVPIFIHKALRNEQITIFGDGDQTRDFVFVQDVAAANAFFAESDAPAGVYNVAYGGKTTINDLASRIISLTGSSSEIRYAEERPGDVRHSMASIDKLKAAGFEPKSDFDKGLAQTIEYFREVQS
ncbi:NAD-dependent epimerase/dehydratase family protein [Sedimentisphaera salicampi]|uniref:NAD-dependent epimerase/dehydratase family protein n=1 Tax=Sedimentisphaera salicampi TaxID=1941349 RepID=UPI000B9A2FE5|nr:NAD-dependent epimerase/dehydratase family protein [Sedimentisphaera salicampi]OXU15558.1 UDP-glucose 4-epimerase [Sedimentisphaera salicampi]